jgi:uncharacterized protein (DUF1778 family)
MVTTTRSSTKRSPRRVTKSRRIAFRLTEELGEQLERAVALSGRSQTDLITEAIAEKTSEVIREQYILELTDRDMDALLEAIANPPEPNDAMLRSIARWRELGMDR